MSNMEKAVAPLGASERLVESANATSDGLAKCGLCGKNPAENKDMGQCPECRKILKAANLLCDCGQHVRRAGKKLCKYCADRVGSTLCRECSDAICIHEYEIGLYRHLCPAYIEQLTAQKKVCIKCKGNRKYSEKVLF